MLQGIPAPTYSREEIDSKVQPLQVVGGRTGFSYEGNSPFGISSTGNPATMSRTKQPIFGDPDEIEVVLVGADLIPVTEEVSPINGYRVQSATVASGGGGSGHAVGNILTLAAGNPTPARVRVDAVSGGAILKVSIIDPGYYDAVFADGQAQTATTGSGTGATFNAEWTPVSHFNHIAIEPNWDATPTLSGPNALKPLRKGILKDGTKNVDLVVVPGEILVTDPAPIHGGGLYKKFIALRRYARANGNALPRGRLTIPDVEYAVSSGPPGDVAHAANALAGVPASAFAQPQIIRGRPRLPVFSCFAVGDSIPAASLDPLGDGAGNIGFYERAIGPYGPAINASRSGASMSNMVNAVTGRAWRQEIARLCNATAYFQALVGANDFDTAGEYAQFADREALLVEEMRGYGFKYIWTCTSWPKTNVANTVPHAIANANIQARNAALRNGTHPADYDFFVDWGTLGEAVIGNGLWPAAHVPTDSVNLVHPPATWHAAGGDYLETVLAENIPEFGDARARVLAMVS